VKQLAVDTYPIVEARLDAAIVAVLAPVTSVLWAAFVLARWLAVLLLRAAAAVARPVRLAAGWATRTALAAFRAVHITRRCASARAWLTPHRRDRWRWC
jgi:hypothetical protein